MGDGQVVRLWGAGILSHHGFVSKSGGGTLEVWDMTTLVLGKFGLVWSEAIFAGLETGWSGP